MFYRNGREAKHGDRVVKLDADGGQVISFGVLQIDTSDDDDGNCSIAPITDDTGTYMCDCVHVDDLADVLKATGLGIRPRKN